jgi:transposase
VQTLKRGGLLTVDEKQLPESMCLQEVAMNLLATGYTVEEAAEILSVTPSTIYTWYRRDPSFKPTVNHLRKQMEGEERRE